MTSIMNYMADDIKQFSEEIKKHFDIVAEDLKGTITQIAEGVSINSELLEQLTKRVDAVEEQLDNLQGMRPSIESIKDDVSRIRVHLGSLRENIEKRPTHEDLSALDKRVWRLERKLQGA